MKRSLLARLEALEGGNDDMEGYYRWLRACDAFMFRHLRREALRRQADGEYVGHEWALLPRYAESKFSASLPDGAAFPEFGSEHFPATRAQTRFHLQRRAWLKAWSAGEGVEHMREIRERIKAMACPEPVTKAPGAAIETPKPETSPEVHEPHGVNPGVAERVRRPILRVSHEGETLQPKVINFPRPEGADWYKPGRDDRDDPSFQLNYPD